MSVRPLFSYYGGKQNIAKRIVSILPKHKVYCEPFAGGAAVLFAKPPPKTMSEIEVINDTNGFIVALYRMARDRPIELFKKLKRMPYSREEHARAKMVSDDADDMEKAVAAFVGLEQSFSKILFDSWSHSRARNRPNIWRRKILNLIEAMKRLEGVYIESNDAIECIKKWDSESTCFYCDPPYPGSHQGHYYGYSQLDFDALIDVARNGVGSFVISSYFSDATEGWRCHTIKTVASASPFGNTPRLECLWVLDRTNDNVKHGKRQSLLFSGYDYDEIESI